MCAFIHQCIFVKCGVCIHTVNRILLIECVELASTQPVNCPVDKTKYSNRIWHCAACLWLPVVHNSNTCECPTNWICRYSFPFWSIITVILFSKILLICSGVRHSDKRVIIITYTNFIHIRPSNRCYHKGG